jgi:hypothetical protein
MILEVVALLMIIDGEIKEHRIQIDPDTNKPSMAMCLKGKRHATRGEKKYNEGSNITHQCIKSMAETELNIDGSKSIKKLILE